jgi:methionyl aminopeptidase
LTSSFLRLKEISTPPPRQIHRKPFNQKYTTTIMDHAPAKEVTVNNERKCEGADCSNDAGSLQCPTCQKLGKESYFCGQDCFKRNWVGQ